MATRIRIALVAVLVCTAAACSSNSSGKASGATAAPTSTTAAVPSADFYKSQSLKPGLNYIKTRDGVTLSAMVRLPGPIENGPYPTVVEYSGYDASDPDSPQPSTLISGFLGYATVGVNVRGTGCSGGAFDFFESRQVTDGYDVVETVAAQPWTKFNKVGMVGLSYPGISQLFVAQSNPPSLAAIAPLSVIADTFRSTLYPGGIFNNGFALSWAKDRVAGAKPSPSAWVKKRIDGGDSTCEANQAAHAQAPDILARINQTKFVSPKDEYLAPELFVNKIKMPVFLLCAFQDEQVGGQCPVLAGEFTGTDKAKFTFVNGYHADPLQPDIFQRWVEFLSLYVKREVPVTPDAIRVGLPLLSQQVWGVTNLTLPPDRFTGQTDYNAVLAKFESEPKVRVLFDSGGDPANPGAPIPQFEQTFAQWPTTNKGTTWYFDAQGKLVDTSPSGGQDNYVSDPGARPAADFDYADGKEAELWGVAPAYNWTPLSAANAVAYTSAPLAQDTVAVGSGSVDLYLQSSASDTDLQVTLTEVRPDGKETYVQSGWLRASRRATDPKRYTDLRPYQTFSEADAKPLPSGTFSLARVEIFPFAHAFRVGSRIRISVEAPGGDRPRWTFDSIDATAKPTNTISRGGANASRIVLPIVDSVTVSSPLPACPSLRGQPCRDYVVAGNGG
ncbi:MAG: CocE/NonD family hydrolase [Acidimicrobiia bacterium]